MKILYLTPTSIYSGAEKITLGIARAMASRGHTALYCGLEGPIREEVESAGIVFHALPSFSLRTVLTTISRHAPDIVHCMDFRASTYAACGKTPFIAHLHSNPPWLHTLSPNTWAMLFFSLRTKHIIAVSSCVYDEYIFGSPLRKRVTVLPNRLDMAAVIEKSTAYPVNALFDMAFVGRLTQEKQPLEFVSQLARLRSHIPDVRAVMVGDGPLKTSLQKEIARLRLEDAITLTGYLSNPFPVIAASRVLLVPSHWEGFGLAALEAMALGKPVVARAVGGLKDIVNQDCGALCHSTEDMLSALLELLTDEATYTAKSRASIGMAQSFGDMSSYYASMEHMYQQT